MNRNFGFTLIELIVTATIIAIVALTATSVYTSFVRQARRSEAIADILSIQIAEERYRMFNTKFGSISVVWNKTTTDSGAYFLDVSNINATSYTITATAIGHQISDSVDGVSCNKLSLSIANGIQTKTPAECWEK